MGSPYLGNRYILLSLHDPACQSYKSTAPKVVVIGHGMRPNYTFSEKSVQFGPLRHAAELHVVFLRKRTIQPVEQTRPRGTGPIAVLVVIVEVIVLRISNQMLAEGPRAASGKVFGLAVYRPAEGAEWVPSPRG